MKMISFIESLLPQVGDAIKDPCCRCLGPDATYSWGLCRPCRDELQMFADREVLALAKRNRGWYNPRFVAKLKQSR